MVRTARIILVSLLLLCSAVLPISAGQTDTPPTRQPLDMMLIIDNSCSMFPRSQIIPGCEVWGNDPDFLRISGAALFMARLGFAEPDAASYQLGVISMGEAPPKLISPLKPLPDARGSLARAISNPRPELATQLMPALVLAYEQLISSPDRRPGNAPAVVLLTDGAPYPAAGQSDADIEALVASHPGIPFFMILLQNPTQPNESYSRYIQFWERMQRDHQNVRTYRAASSRDIERTYNEIVALLQNSIPTSGTPLDANETLNIYIGRFVTRVIITVTHQPTRPRGQVTVTDPRDAVVRDDDISVEHFNDPDNPNEVISIGTARLDLAPRDANWQIKSTEPVTVFLDRVGAYRIEFVAPPVGNTSIPNQYLANQRVSPSTPFAARFRLLDLNNVVVRDVQPISGFVVNPDGSRADLRVPTTLRPDAEGVYEITHDFAAGYFAVTKTPGRFALTLEAGEADDSTGTRVPIARSQLLVDVGRGAYIAAVSPQPLICAPSQPAAVTVTAGDLDAANLESVRIRVFGAGQEVLLTAGGGDAYVGDIGPLCQALLAGMACGQTLEASFPVRMAALTSDGNTSPPSERLLPVQAQSILCTPTPVPPTATPLPPTQTPIPPTPTPTPLPNRDGDRLWDGEDRCPEKAELELASWFGGCPPPWWAWVLAALLIVATLAVLGGFLIPLLLVLTIKPPPAGYIVVCRDGEQVGPERSIKGVGVTVRRSVVTVGPNGHIRTPKTQTAAPTATPARGRQAKGGPKRKSGGDVSIICRVARVGGESVVMSGAKGPQAFQIGAIPREVHAGDVTIKFSTEPGRSKCR